jgi:hypothetical protein
MVAGVYVAEDLMLARFDISVPDNLRARRVRTQMILLRRLAISFIIVVDIGLVLSIFRDSRIWQYGAGLLASAGLASLVLARGLLLWDDAAAVRRSQLLLVSPLIGYCSYVLAGPLVRLAFLTDLDAGVLKEPVRISAAVAALATAGLVAGWPRLAPLFGRRWGTGVATALAVAGTVWNVAQFADWAAHRSYKNYEASVALGRALPGETLVQGKLANGLALENRIRPIFIGHQFGNYADRKQRWDVRYILTYTDPEIGYEGDQIVDVLAAYPGWQMIMTFDVAETRSGHDKAALIEKRARH